MQPLSSRDANTSRFVGIHPIITLLHTLVFIAYVCLICTSQQDNKKQTRGKRVDTSTASELDHMTIYVTGGAVKDELNRA